jgi:peptidyl-prolyl cis-trans isomerase D
MALIGKIREKSALLVIVIGLALLAFILSDYEKITGGSDSVYGYGTVYGEKIDFAKYDESRNKFEEQDKNQYAQQNREYDQKAQEASADKAWSYLTEMAVLEKEFDALGIDVNDAEFDAYLYGTNGFTVLPDLAQGFTDSITGQFNPKMLQKRLEEMQNSSDPQIQQSWADSKQYYIERRKQEKYFAILNQGVYVTKLEAEEEYFAQKEIKNISFVLSRYFDIKDEEIKLTDDEVKNFFEEHKNEKKYENKTASREVRFFDISIQASKADSVKFNKKISELKSKFGQTKNDSLFVLANSDFKRFSSQHEATFRPEGDPKAREGMTYPKDLDTIFKTASVGQVVGPYQDKGMTRVVKVLDFNTNVMKVRHILLAAPKGDDKAISAAERKADSLLKFINTDNFGEYVTKFTEDPGSKETGGVYEDFMDYEMVPEFSKFSTDKPIGTIGWVKTDFGIHIMEVLDRKKVKYPVLAVIEKTLIATQETIDDKEQEVYSLLYKLDEKVGNMKDEKAKVEMFDSIVQMAGYFARPLNLMEDNPKVFGFISPLAEDKILKLAFDEEAKVGTLCSSPIKDKNRYVLAMVSAIKNKGVPKFENVEKVMRAELMENKKALRLTQQMLGKKSLEELAKKGNTEVMSAEVTFANPQITGGGYEAEITGALFSGLKDGQMSLPLKGKSGVYVVRIDKTTKPPTASSYELERDQMMANQKGSVVNSAKTALMKKADVIDNRRFLKIGVRR